MCPLSATCTSSRSLKARLQVINQPIGGLRPLRRSLALGLSRKAASELGELLECLGKVISKLCLVGGVRFEVHLEPRVPCKDHIRHQHHLIRIIRTTAVGLLVDVLAVTRRRPQLGGSHGIEPRVRVVDQPPLVLEHVCRVLVRKLSRVLNPRAGIARSGRVAAAIDVPAAQKRYNLAVVEAHAVEDLVAYVRAQAFPPPNTPLCVRTLTELTLHVRAEVLFGGRQAAVRHTLLLPVRAVGMVGAPWCEGDGRTPCVLDAHVRREDPQVGVADGRELALHWLEERTGSHQASILRVGGLGLEAHAGAVGAARPSCLVVRAAAMPREPDEDGC
mmetsp:Transcript_69/g.217  ORF Transcript_69/g.217 Transcript_69/m.217 type:complete len:332 (-) Transcript_69:390-1385(-)